MVIKINNFDFPTIRKILKQWLTGFSFAFFWLCCFLLITSASGIASKPGRTGPLPENSQPDTATISSLLALTKKHIQDDFQKSLHYAEKALEIAESSKNDTLIALGLSNIGNVYFRLGQFSISTRFFFRSLLIEKKMKNQHGVAVALLHLGGIRLQTGAYRQAQNNFNEALGILMSLNPEDSANQPVEIISLYNNLGIACQKLKEQTESVDYYFRGIALARKYPGQELNLARLLNNLGSVYMEYGRLNEAYTAITEALEIRSRAGDTYGTAQSYRMLATYYHEAKNKKKEIENLNKGFIIAQQLGDLALNSEIIAKLFNYYYEDHKADSALKYHILYAEYNDKINLQSTQNELTKLEMNAKFEEKEKARQYDQKQRELRYLFIGISMVMVLLILGLLYFLSSSRVRRLRLEKENISLASKNLELEKSGLENELELRNRELATSVMHRIQKNELIHDVVQRLMQRKGLLRKEDQKILLDVIRDLERSTDAAAWNEFEVRFNQVHTEFYHKLNAINPDLSPNERRLCAFLRLNMTTKEIASITGQTVRSIEVARTRLRKKINLTNSDSGLIEFLSQL